VALKRLDLHTSNIPNYSEVSASSYRSIQNCCWKKEISRKEHGSLKSK